MLGGEGQEEGTMKKVIVLATAVIALAIGTAVGLTLASTTNAKVVMSCEGNSCSVKLPGVLLNEMNTTMTKTMGQFSASEEADEQAFLKELSKLFEHPTAKHDGTTADRDAELVREVRKLFR
jgi:hypothetical protein